MEGEGGGTPAGLFLSRALQKILAEKDVKKKENATLRSACEKAMGEQHSAAQQTRRTGRGRRRGSAERAAAPRYGRAEKSDGGRERSEKREKRRRGKREKREKERADKRREQLRANGSDDAPMAKRLERERERESTKATQKAQRKKGQSREEEKSRFVRRSSSLATRPATAADLAQYIHSLSTLMRKHAFPPRATRNRKEKETDTSGAEEKGRRIRPGAVHRTQRCADGFRAHRIAHLRASRSAGNDRRQKRRRERQRESAENSPFLLARTSTLERSLFCRRRFRGQCRPPCPRRHPGRRQRRGAARLALQGLAPPFVSPPAVASLWPLLFLSTGLAGTHASACGATEGPVGHCPRHPPPAVVARKERTASPSMSLFLCRCGTMPALLHSSAHGAPFLQPHGLTLPPRTPAISRRATQH